MDVFRLGRELEVDELHVLPAAEANILHEGLQKGLGAGFTVRQRPGNDGVEHIGLFDAARDMQELEERVEVFDIVDTGTLGLAI
jgi:hypothetical protein